MEGKCVSVQQNTIFCVSVDKVPFKSGVATGQNWQFMSERNTQIECEDASVEPAG